MADRRSASDAPVGRRADRLEEGVRVRFGVVTFPGSNCDQDCVYVLRSVLGQNVDEVWHEDRSVDGLDAIVLPGGFAHGDYLRAGAIAARAPLMSAVGAFARAGGPALGICNGCHVRVDVRQVPGALMWDTGYAVRGRSVFCSIGML